MVSPSNKKPFSPDEKKEENKLVNSFPVSGEAIHLGSSSAFEETEDPRSKDPDDLTDEKLDEWLDE